MAKAISAQVVLKPAAGGPPSGVNVTAENVRDVLPSQQGVALARKAFADAGFKVGAVVGNSFSITAPATTFEKTLGAKFVDAGAGTDGRSREGLDLPLPPNALTKDARALVKSIVFSAQPDFGPGNY